MFIAEGPEVVASALSAGVLPEALYVSADRADEVADVLSVAQGRGVRTFELASGAMEKVSDTVTPQPLLAVFAQSKRSIEELQSATLVLVLAEVRDPGNLGTALRSADAAGFDAVVTTKGTVDPFNPKAVRSSAGSIFHCPVVRADDAHEVLATLRGFGLSAVGATARASIRYLDYDWSKPVCIVVGNEASGLPRDLHVTDSVAIPMVGRTESLNVSMAATLLCFEAMRSRARL